MNRSTFDQVVDKLKNIGRLDTQLRPAIPLAKRVAIGLYALGSSAEYRTIASLFGVGRTTVGEIVREISQEIIDKLGPCYLNAYPPTHDKIVEIVSGFDKMGFPQCYGAIDGCHIEVNVPKSEAVDYYNFKGWHSVLLFAAVDYKYRFTYINVGAPGRSNDSTIYENSALKKVHETNPIFREYSKTIEGVNVPILLIGDSAFKLSSTVMKPFPFSGNQSAAEKLFNYHLAKCRRVVENGFGHLKARFRRIGKGLEVNIDNVNSIIKACCILHNVCKENNDTVNRSWMVEMNQMVKKPQPQRSSSSKTQDPSGTAIRLALMNHFGK